MKTQPKTKRAAIRQIKAIVREFMRDATKDAIAKIDKLQAAGVDIAGDHIEARGPYAIPRDFIAAYAEEMKNQIGMVRHSPRSRSRRINNYYRFL